MSWPMVKLGDLSEYIRNGASIKQSSDASGLPITRIETIADRTVNLEKCGYADVAEDEYQNYRLQRSDILISHINSEKHLAKCAIYEDDRKDIVHGMNLLCLRPDCEVAYPKYLFHFLSSPTFLRCIPSITKKSVNQASFTVTAFKDLEIPLPPLPEQKRIAAILDKADGIRRKRQQAIQLADDFLRSVFLDMFGDPVTNPKGWEVKAFGDLGKWASGGTPSRANSDYFEGDINWYSARELNTRYLTGSVEKITETALKESAAKVFPENSMLVGMYDTAAFKISILREPSASNQACANLIPNASVDIEWFYSFIEFSKETYLRQRRGVRQKNLNLGMIKEFELPLPPIESQREFKKVADKLLSSKALQVKSLISSDGSFNSLSQKAFKGEL